jgi:CubicO group peptidase (beta-lactamase class C family)
MDKIRRTMGIIFVLTGLLVGCLSPVVAPTPVPTDTPISAAPPAAAYWPTEGWRSTTPEEQGIDSEKLAEMVAYIQAEQPDLHSLLIVRNGYLVSEIYGHPYSAAQTHWLASVTKSVVSALVGIAIQQGKIQDVHQPLFSLLPQGAAKNFDENKKKITIEDLLTMKSGLDCYDFPPPGQPLMEKSANWVDFTLDLPMAAVPGTSFRYCSEVTQLLSAALQQAIEMSTREYANQVLFPQIGIPPVPEERWGADPQGVTIGGYELSLTPREMAKFGYLFLHQGRWDGQQVVPAEWVAVSTQWHADRGDGLGYGYLWNLDPGGQAFAAIGRAGQNIFIYPALNLEVVFTAGLPSRDQNDFSPLVELLNGYVLPAVKSDRALPANPGAVTRLQAGVQALTQPRQDLPPLPAMAAKISGKAFSLEKNPLGWIRLALTFPAGQAEAVAFATFDGVHQTAIGLDNLYRVSDSGYASFPTGLRGWWVDENTFVINPVLIGMMTEYTYTFRFSGETTLQLTQVEKYTGEEMNIQGVLSR